MRQRWVLLLTLSAALCGYGLSQDSAGTARQRRPTADTPAPADTPGSMSAPTVPDIPVAPTATQTVPPALKTDAAAKPDAKEEKDDFDFPHDGKIDDVNAIGNRNVGCSKGLGNWYSLESQVRLGKSYAMQVEQSAKVINDPVVSEYINRIAQNLVRNSDAKVPFTVKVSGRRLR